MSLESSEGVEYAAAVAAAAFAITSLESDAVDQRKPKMAEFRESFKTSADEDKAKDSEKYPNEENEMMPEKTIHPVPSIKKTPTTPKKRLTFADERVEDTPIASLGRTPSIKKTPSLGDEHDFEDAKSPAIPNIRRTRSQRKTPSFGEQLEDTKPVKPESVAVKPIVPSPIPRPHVPPLTIEPAAKGARGPPGQETDADAWEREEMAKIKQRYEKLNATILEWEDKKRKKARRKLETTESNVDKRRAKAMQNYQIEMERIKQIADGARAQAKDKQRNEELKVREKASRYRATGEPPLPPACLCL